MIRFKRSSGETQVGELVGVNGEMVKVKFDGLQKILPIAEVEFLESECDCPRCRKMCDRPCWPTPDEARRLIELGHGDRLMADYWVDDENVYLLSPAIPGHEGERAPFMPYGGCTFQKDGLCELHGICKPLEGRLAHHDNPNGSKIHKDVADMWRNEQELVMEWRRAQLGT